MFKELYNKTIKLAGHKSSKLILGIISFIESFIFPVPPDVLIIPMTIAKKNDWIKIAFVATIGSVLGALLGYLIGFVFFNEIGVKIFELYGVDNTSFLKEKLSSEGGVIAWVSLLAIAGFTPVPFKLLTITSGFVGFNIFYFIGSQYEASTINEGSKATVNSRDHFYHFEGSIILEARSAQHIIACYCCA